jgi:hypothetical protein
MMLHGMQRSDRIVAITIAILWVVDIPLVGHRLPRPSAWPYGACSWLALPTM